MLNSEHVFFSTFYNIVFTRLLCAKNHPEMVADYSRLLLNPNVLVNLPPSYSRM